MPPGCLGTGQCWVGKMCHHADGEGGDAGGGQEGCDARLLGTQLPLGRAHTAPGQALFRASKTTARCLLLFLGPTKP